MSQWETVNGKSIEVGLSAGQTSGEVGGQTVYRDPSSDITKTYIEAGSAQTTTGYPGDRIAVEVNGQKYYIGRGGAPEIGYYKPETGFTSVRRTGMLSPSEQEQQYREQKGLQPVQPIPSPFQLGQVQYAGSPSPFGKGYFTSPEYQRPTPQIQFPSYLVGRSESEFRVIPRYGQVMPSDIAEGLQRGRTEQTYKSLLPSDIGLSSFSTGFYKGAKGISEGIRGESISNQFLRPSLMPTPTYETPIRMAFPYVRESTARLTEFVGIIPGTTEIWGKTAISKPSALPGMFVYGGLAVATGFGKQAEKEPTQLLSDLIVTTGAFKLAGRASTGITEPIRFMGKKYVPAESIIEPQVLSGVERFPLAKRGTTGAQLVREFEVGKFRMPGTEGKIGGWHATPEAFAKTTLTQPGTSEGTGLYIAPSTSPHFWKIGGGQLKLFGWGEAPTSPAGIWLETAGIRRSPRATRYSIELQNMFLESKATKGTGFISAAFEKGIKPEKEAIIPPETPITRVSNKFYTKYLGKRVPLMEYTAVQKTAPDIVDYGKSTLFEKELPGITSWGRQHIEAGGQFFPHGVRNGLTFATPLLIEGAIIGSQFKKEITPTSYQIEIVEGMKAPYESLPLYKQLDIESEYSLYSIEEYMHVSKPVFEKIGVDVSKIDIKPSLTSKIGGYGRSWEKGTELPESVFGEAPPVKGGKYISLQKPTVAVSMNVPPSFVLSSIGHEVGHLVSRHGMSKVGILAESRAISIENIFLREFNKMYGTKYPQTRFIRPEIKIPDVYTLGEAYSKVAPAKILKAYTIKGSLELKTKITLQKEETFGELAQRQIKISSEYSRYKEPIFTPSSIVSSIRSSYRPTSMSSISLKSSYTRLGVSSPVRYAASSIYGGISTQIYPSTTSTIYSPGRSTYTSKIDYPGKTTYPGYTGTPITSFSPITTIIKPKLSIDLFRNRKRSIRMHGGFKFPEISRVALPKQIMKGFRL